MKEYAPPDTYIKLYLDESVFIVADDESLIDAAVTRYIESGETIDTLLSLTHVSGAAFKARASEVRSWFLSTPETRQNEGVFEEKGNPAGWKDSE